MILKHENYRSYLKAELAERITANPAYSLRAFAQKLGLSVSFLSEVLQAKKSLSADAALKVAMRLSLGEAESRYFCLLAQLNSEKDPAYREEIARKLQELNPERKTRDLSMDVFRAISDWYHFAILELTYVSDFEVTPKAAARALGISSAEADAAIERLLRLELLEKDGSGRLRKVKEYVLAKSEVPNAAIKSFHAQMLTKAETAVHEQEPADRVSATDVIPLDAGDIEKVRELSEHFATAVLKLSTQARRKTDVYCLSTHFFSLTSLSKKGALKS